MKISFMSDKEGSSIKTNGEDSFHQDLIYDNSSVARSMKHENFINIKVGTVYPMSIHAIRLSESQGTHLKMLVNSHSHDYEMRKVTNDIILIYFNNKIFIPTDLARSILEWYHLAMSHAEEEKMYRTNTQHFNTVNMKPLIKEICSQCHICQVNKVSTVNSVKLPPRLVTMEPWATLAVDLVGPWTVSMGWIWNIMP